MILRNVHPVYRDEEGNIVNKLEIDRMMPALKQIRIKIRKKEILDLALACGAHQRVRYEDVPSWCDLAEDSLVNYITLFDMLHDYTFG